MPKYYLLDENKNLVEVVNIEDNLFRTRLEKLHSEVNDTDHSIEFVTQAKYNQLQAQGQLVGNTYYFITDDTTAEDLESAIESNTEDIASHETRLTEAEGRLDALGFKTGVATSSYIGFTSQSLMKQGKMALFNMVSASQINVPTSGDKYITIAFPTDFKPQDDIQVRVISTAIRNLVQFTADLIGTLETDGVLYLTLPHNSQYATSYIGFSIVNAGWRLK